jgi:ABC-type xylose transport system permease subunit
MLRRFLLGLIEGLVIGLALAVASARGLGLTTPGRVTAAVLAGVVGFLVGLVAGRPVWARDAKTEALLKAAAGALVGAGLSLALGHWLAAPVDLSQFALGAGPVGELLAVSLPAIACALSLFFELDDTTSRAAPARVAAAPAQKRHTLPANDHAELAELAELAEPSDDSRSKLEKR